MYKMARLYIVVGGLFEAIGERLETRNREILEGIGYIIKYSDSLTYSTSGGFTSGDSTSGDSTSGDSIKAVNTVRDISFSDTVVFESTILKEGELGVALGLLKDVYVVGRDRKTECGLFKHPSIEYVDSWDEIVSRLKIKD
jgi:hypothetical protein